MLDAGRGRARGDDRPAVNQRPFRGILFARGLPGRLRRGIRRAVRSTPGLSSLAIRVVGRGQALRDRGLPLSERWLRHRRDEVAYWEDVLSGEDAQHRFAARLDPVRPISEACLEIAVSEIPSATVRVIDVGSGPLTSVGTTHPGKSIKLVATDALADDYQRIIREHDISAPVIPIACGGEDLIATFGRSSFDVAFASNALDHTTDPLAIINNMLEIVAPDGRVALIHLRNEGTRNRYRGLHAWNVDFVDGRLVFWNSQARHDITAVLEPEYDVETWVTDAGARIQAVIRPAAPKTRQQP